MPHDVADVADEGASAPANRNEVRLVGRLAAPAQTRELPSGDQLVCFRIVVRRSEQERGGRPRSPTVDTLDCVAWRAGVRRTVSAWEPGDTVAVEGALRRRFWRAGAGAVSRSEVEVARARRVARS